MKDTARTSPRVLFMYLGRHGALGAFISGLAEATRVTKSIDAHFLLAASNPASARIAAMDLPVHTADLFHKTDPLSLIKGFLSARTQLAGLLREIRPMAVVNLMPHIFTPILAPLVRKQGVKYVTVIHDAAPHPGDPTARVTRWLLRDTRHADLIVTLSRTVATALARDGYARRARVCALFHPDIGPADQCRARLLSSNSPFRILFFGRIMAYKGLETLVAAVEELRSKSVRIELGIAGSGKIPQALESRLTSVGAEVLNRWIDDDEVPRLFDRYDAIACPHAEASQSGVAALAFGYGMPVVAMPVGGIAEQVQDGLMGTVATAATSPDFARAIERLAGDGEFYGSISAHIFANRQERSWQAFLARLMNELE